MKARKNYWQNKLPLPLLLMLHPNNILRFDSASQYSPPLIVQPLPQGNAVLPLSPFNLPRLMSSHRISQAIYYSLQRKSMDFWKNTAGLSLDYYLFNQCHCSYESNWEINTHSHIIYTHKQIVLT